MREGRREGRRGTYLGEIRLCCEFRTAEKETKREPLTVVLAGKRINFFFVFVGISLLTIPDLNQFFAG